MTPLDPEIVRRMAWLADYSPDQIAANPDIVKRIYQAFAPSAAYTLPAMAVEDVLIDGPLGIGSLRVRTYRPDKGARNGPALVWVHGGGFIAGTLDEAEADTVSREVADRSGCVVVSVDYHLSDAANGYPTLHEEVAAAFRWTRDNAVKLGCDAGRVVLGGASAGGNLALMATLLLRDQEEVNPAELFLVYPLLHRTPLPWRDSEPDFSGLSPLMRFTTESYDMMYGAYSAHWHGNAPYLSIEGHRLDGLPPCLVITSEYDDLRTSAEAFADAAREAGVQVIEYLAREMTHGHLALTPEIGETGRTLSLLANRLVGLSAG